jgi:hypothetical protein
MLSLKIRVRGFGACFFGSTYNFTNVEANLQAITRSRLVDTLETRQSMRMISDDKNLVKHFMDWENWFTEKRCRLIHPIF